MTTHERCPECGVETVALSAALLWRGGCPERHWLGPTRSDSGTALDASDEVLRAYHRKQAAVRAERSIPQDVERLLKKVKRLENNLLPSDGAHLNTICDRVLMLEDLAATNRECRVRLANRVTKLGDRIATLEREPKQELGVDQSKRLVMHSQRLEALERRLAALEREPKQSKSAPESKPDATWLQGQIDKLKDRVSVLESGLHRCGNCTNRRDDGICRLTGVFVHSHAGAECSAWARILPPSESRFVWKPQEPPPAPAYVAPAAEPPGSPTMKEAEDPLSPEAQQVLDEGLKSAREKPPVDLGSFAQYSEPKRRECWEVLDPCGQPTRWAARKPDLLGGGHTAHRMVELREGEEIVPKLRYSHKLAEAADRYEALCNERDRLKKQVSVLQSQQEQVALDFAKGNERFRTLEVERDRLAESNARLEREAAAHLAKVAELQRHYGELNDTLEDNLNRAEETIMRLRARLDSQSANAGEK